MLGLSKDTVQVHPHSPEWERLFDEEAARIRSAIGDCVLDVQHIGSTSVPGLAAKPIIDIGIAVADFEEATRCVQPLMSLGYHYMGEHGIPRRHFFFRGDPRTHQIHMNELASFDWQQTIRFRDHLRAHPDVATDYGELKLGLAQQFATDLAAYQAGKNAFIKEIVTAAFAMAEVRHLTMEELEAGLDTIRRSPEDHGVLELIVRRPEVGHREIMDEGQLDLIEGLVGDNWRTRGSSRTSDKSSHPDMQLNIVNTRAIALVAQRKDRWQLAGDQLFIDIDLSEKNMPAGTRLSLGSAVIEVTDQPHTGCKKFVERFGLDAMKFVNSSVGKELHLRGINARVVEPGVIRVGDIARKI